MSSNMIIGIGGSGGAIASYMNTKIGIQLSQMNNSIAIIDTDPTHYSTHPPLFHITGMIFDSNENFTSFIQTVLQYPFPHEIIITTGFTGQSTRKIIRNTLKFCTDHSIKLTISGIEPFRFEGRKKSKEAQDFIVELTQSGVDVIPFSNNDLLDPLANQTPIEEALESNYQKILEQVILPILSAPKPQHVDLAVPHLPKSETKMIVQAPMFRPKKCMIIDSPKGLLFTSAIGIGILIGFFITYLPF